jgi:hypothetical protein
MKTLLSWLLALVWPTVCLGQAGGGVSSGPTTGGGGGSQGSISNALISQALGNGILTNSAGNYSIPALNTNYMFCQIGNAPVQTLGYTATFTEWTNGTASGVIVTVGGNILSNSVTIFTNTTGSPVGHNFSSANSTYNGITAYTWFAGTTPQMADTNDVTLLTAAQLATVNNAVQLVGSNSYVAGGFQDLLSSNASSSFGHYKYQNPQILSALTIATNAPTSFSSISVQSGWNPPAGATGDAIGIEGSVWPYGTNNAPSASAEAFKATAVLLSGTNFNTLTGYKTECGNETGQWGTPGGLLATCCGLWVGSPLSDTNNSISGYGPITTTIGVNIDAQSGPGIGAAYGICQNGASDHNVFAGSTQVNSGLSVSNGLTVNSGNVGISTGNLTLSAGTASCFTSFFVNSASQGSVGIINSGNGWDEDFYNPSGNLHWYLANKNSGGTVDGNFYIREYAGAFIDAFKFETNSTFTALGAIVATTGFSSLATSTAMSTTANGCTNTTSMVQIAYITAATGATLKDNAGNTEFSSVTIAAFTPVRIQVGGKFTGTAITYAAGAAAHAW